MEGGGKNKIPNGLQLARKRRGLSQKLMAYLLNHHSTDQISRYEKGGHLPTLRIALKLQIILGVQLELLFQDLQKELREEIKQRVQSNAALKDFQLLGEGLCSYSNAVDLPSPGQLEINKAYDHLAKLSRKLADFPRTVT